MLKLDVPTKIGTKTQKITPRKMGMNKSVKNEKASNPNLNNKIGLTNPILKSR